MRNALSGASIADPQTATDVTVECPRFTRVLILLGIPVMVAVTLVLAGLMVSMPFMPARKLAKLGTANLVTIYFLFPLVIALFCWATWSIVRHREGLFTTFRLSASGIVVQNARYGVLALNWADVAATYSRVGKLIVLTSSRLAKPLAVMNFGGRSLAPEFITARTMIRSQLGDRWTERWLA